MWKKCKNKKIVQETNSDDNNANNGLSFENKTVDEIINYINEDKDNKKKKKKRNKKKNCSPESQAQHCGLWNKEQWSQLH